jgi:hypothetical protein
VVLHDQKLVLRSEGNLERPGLPNSSPALLLPVFRESVWNRNSRPAPRARRPANPAGTHPKTRTHYGSTASRPKTKRVRITRVSKPSKKPPLLADLLPANRMSNVDPRQLAVVGVLHLLLIVFGYNTFADTAREVGNEHSSRRPPSTPRNTCKSWAWAPETHRCTSGVGCRTPAYGGGLLTSSNNDPSFRRPPLLSGLLNRV